MATIIKQVHLQDVLDQREHIAELKKALKQLEDVLLKDELVLIHDVAKGVAVERGPLGALIDEKAGQRRPSWKDAFAERLGALEVQRVIDATPVSPGKQELVITERGAIRK